MLYVRQVVIFDKKEKFNVILSKDPFTCITRQLDKAISVNLN